MLFRYPLQNPTITQGYGATEFAQTSGKEPNGFHTGIDMISSNKNVYAARKGVVTYAGWDKTGFGNLVKIEHDDNSISYYGHNSSIAVKVGDMVYEETAIAIMGNTGNTNADPVTGQGGIHLHFGVKVKGNWIDPTSYLLSETMVEQFEKLASKMESYYQDNITGDIYVTYMKNRFQITDNTRDLIARFVSAFFPDHFTTKAKIESMFPNKKDTLSAIYK